MGSVRANAVAVLGIGAHLPLGTTWRWQLPPGVVGIGESSGTITLDATRALTLWVPRGVAAGRVVLATLDRVGTVPACRIEVVGDVIVRHGWQVSEPATWPLVVSPGSTLPLRWVVVNTGNAADSVTAWAQVPPGWHGAEVRIRPAIVVPHGEAVIEVYVHVPQPVGYSHPVIELMLDTGATQPATLRLSGPVRLPLSVTRAQETHRRGLLALGVVQVARDSGAWRGRSYPTLRAQVRFAGDVDLAVDGIVAPLARGLSRTDQRRMSRVAVVSSVPMLRLSAPSWNARGGAVAWSAPSGELLGARLFGVGLSAAGQSLAHQWGVLAARPWTRDAAGIRVSGDGAARLLAAQWTERLGTHWSLGVGASSLRDARLGDAVLQQWDAGQRGAGVDTTGVDGAAWSANTRARAVALFGQRTLDAVAIRTGFEAGGWSLHPEVAVRRVGELPIGLGYGSRVGFDGAGWHADVALRHAPGGIRGFASATDQASGRLGAHSRWAQFVVSGWRTADPDGWDTPVVRGVTVSPRLLFGRWSIGVRARARDRQSVIDRLVESPTGAASSASLCIGAATDNACRTSRRIASPRVFAEREALVGGMGRLGAMGLSAWVGAGAVRDGAVASAPLYGVPQWRWDVQAGAGSARGQWQLRSQGSVQAQWAGRLVPVWTRTTSVRVIEWRPWSTSDWLGLSGSAEHFAGASLPSRGVWGGRGSLDVLLGAWNVRAGADYTPRVAIGAFAAPGVVTRDPRAAWRGALRVEHQWRVDEAASVRTVSVRVCRVVSPAVRCEAGRGVAGVRVVSGQGSAVTNEHGVARVAVVDAGEVVVLDPATLPPAVIGLLGEQRAEARRSLEFQVSGAGQWVVRLAPDSALASDVTVPWERLRVFAEDRAGRLWRPVRRDAFQFEFVSLPEGGYRAVIDLRPVGNQARMGEDTTWHQVVFNERDSIDVPLFGRPVQFVDSSAVVEAGAPVVMSFAPAQASTARRKARRVAKRVPVVPTVPVTASRTPVPAAAPLAVTTWADRWYAALQGAPAAAAVVWWSVDPSSGTAADSVGSGNRGAYVPTDMSVPGTARDVSVKASAVHAPPRVRSSARVAAPTPSASGTQFFRPKALGGADAPRAVQPASGAPGSSDANTSGAPSAPIVPATSSSTSVTPQ